MCLKQCEFTPLFSTSQTSTVKVSPFVSVWPWSLVAPSAFDPADISCQLISVTPSTLPGGQHPNFPVLTAHPNPHGLL